METPHFHLEAIVREKDRLQDFEGPLSLILMLLQKNKIEIRDLSITDILNQYLEYLERMQNMDLELASEFVQMASHLLYLKTQTLLKSDEEVSELELLMQSLEQLQARDRFANLQKILPQLKKAAEIGLLYIPKAPEPVRQGKEEYTYQHKPVELLKSLLNIWNRGAVSESESKERLLTVVPHRIRYSVRGKGRELVSILKKGPCALGTLYSRCESSSELVATFLAVLELCSHGGLHLELKEEQIVLYLAGEGTEAEKILEEIEDET